MKNGDLPAMPQTNSDNLCMQTGAPKPMHSGLTKREMFAMQFAGHIWAQYQNDGTSTLHDNWREGVCVESVRLADALLAELECTNGL
jgi:hypothetical protein